MNKSTKRTKPEPRLKHTVYTDDAPDVEAMIQQAKSKGRVFSYYAVTALREWLMKEGFTGKTP